MTRLISHFPGTRLARMASGAALIAAALLAGTTQLAGAAPSYTGACGADLQCLKTLGDSAIDKRITALNKLSSHAADREHLTDAQKSAIEQDAQTVISGLQAEKTTLDGATSASDARSDIAQGVYAQFRVYRVVLPHDYLSIFQERQAYVIAELTAHESTLANAIQQAQTKGKDVTQAQASYEDLQQKVTDAANQNSAALGLLPQITVANDNADHVDTRNKIVTCRADLQTGRTDLQTATRDVKQIVADLKA